MSVLGIAIAQRVLHAVGMEERGKIVLRKRLSRHDLMPLLAKLPPVRIGMEACGGAHDWARRLPRTGPRGEALGAPVREAVCHVAQKRQP